MDDKKQDVDAREGIGRTETTGEVAKRPPLPPKQKLPTTKTLPSDAVSLDRQTTAILQISRPISSFGSARSIDVFIDGAKTVTVKDEGTPINLRVPAGTHEVKANVRRRQSCVYRFHVAPGEQLLLEVKLRVYGVEVVGESLTVVQPRPHRGVSILVFGLIGFIIGLVGLAVVADGAIELWQIMNGKVDRSGIGLVIAGITAGAVGFLVNLFAIILILGGA